MKTINYFLVSASGNPTAIVPGEFSIKDRNTITTTIFKTKKSVEQVGYLYKKEASYYFNMMGDEFSGNGCRAAGFIALSQKAGIVQLQTVGKKIAVSLDKSANSTVTIPYCFYPKNIITNSCGFLIKMLGSYQLVIEGRGNYQTAKNLTQKYFQNSKAAGIMFFQKVSQSIISLDPYFYVRKTKTLVNETACGSGSTAVSIYQNYLKQSNIFDLEIRQPSGESIFSRGYYQNGQIDTINISGPTKLLGSYNVTI